MEFTPRFMHEEDAPAQYRALTSSSPGCDTWQHGVNAPVRQLSPGDNSMLSALLVLVIVLLALNFRHCRRLFKNIPKDLLRHRISDNAFDNHTASESRTQLFLMILLCLSEGIMMLAYASTAGVSITPAQLFSATVKLSGVAAGLYLFQLAAYATVGYTFSSVLAMRQWIRGYNASQAILALFIFLPALVSLVYPTLMFVPVPIACFAYVITRILFISKGFRIFYNNFPSLLYFILYLCTLEIVPLLIVAGIARGILRSY